MPFFKQNLKSWSHRKSRILISVYCAYFCQFIDNLIDKYFDKKYCTYGDTDITSDYRPITERLQRLQRYYKDYTTITNDYTAITQRLNNNDYTGLVVIENPLGGH